MGTDEPKPQDLIAIKADLDPNGQLPEQIHHLETRGAHPEKRVDPSNLIGYSAHTHRQYHDTGQPLPRPPSLEDIW